MNSTSIVLEIPKLQEMVADALSARETPTETLEKPLTEKELCAYLRLSRPTLLRWRKSGQIPYFRVGGSYRYNLKKVIAALDV
jgi:excisionase family DNA binding protein